MNERLTYHRPWQGRGRGWDFSTLSYFRSLATPRLNCSGICAGSEVQVFDLMNRRVRRTYLCGKNRHSEKDYSYRKQVDTRASGGTDRDLRD